MSQHLRIEVVSDFVCPWCYVGKKRLEKALALRPAVQAEVVWRPFQLSPDMPREGRNRAEHYREIFGAERAQQIQAKMRDTGVEEGIVFGASPSAMAPNTLSAHVLMLWADAMPDVDSDRLAEALFNAHHVTCADIGDIDVLKQLASEAGLDAAEVGTKLAAGVDEDKVQSLMSEASARGVTGVPFFIINGRYGLSGAQPPEVLADAFDQILAADAAA